MKCSFSDRKDPVSSPCVELNNILEPVAEAACFDRNCVTPLLPMRSILARAFLWALRNIIDVYIPTFELDLKILFQEEASIEH
jgi:hypothetical protein